MNINDMRKKYEEYAGHRNDKMFLVKQSSIPKTKLSMWGIITISSDEHIFLLFGSEIEDIYKENLISEEEAEETMLKIGEKNE